MKHDPYDGVIGAVAFMVTLLALALVVVAATEDPATKLACLLGAALLLRSVPWGRR